MGITDKITGKAKQVVGDLTGDAKTRRSGAISPPKRGYCSSKMRRRMSLMSSGRVGRPPTDAYQSSHAKGAGLSR